MNKIFGYDYNKQWDYENGFLLTSHMTRLAKMLAHYELYKSIVDLPGTVVECGVFKGASFIRFCTYRQILESPYSRKILGFDAFGKFPNNSNDDSLDQKFIEKFSCDAGNGITTNELSHVLTKKNIDNYELIEGNIENTIPEYIEKHPELKIALLHIDVDVYQPTMVSLQNLYDHVVRGGLVVFDDYSTVYGETKAIDEFFINKKITISKLPISHIPSFIKKS